MFSLLEIPGVDTDYADDASAARPVLTPEQQADLDEFDRWCAQLAREQEPLDGCEDNNWIEDYAAAIAA